MQKLFWFKQVLGTKIFILLIEYIEGPEQKNCN